MRLTRSLSTIALLAAVAATPPLRAADDPLIMGVFPRLKAGETTTRYAPMANYLGKQLGRQVKLVTSKDFESFWQGVVEQRYDIVHYNQYHYIRSAKTYQVVAHIEELGKSTIAGVIYARKESGFTKLAQLRGRTVIFGGVKLTSKTRAVQQVPLLGSAPVIGHLFKTTNVEEQEQELLFFVTPKVLPG